ncbi:hypothetical protein [Microbacterium luticocti]|uniref:hypothetical protein n=1 Tax=Microbacterium luticocti TaxID=451764 RepID=UPI0004188C79|nr:hypothetical protein [Microbacterium luticocti]
MAAAKDRDARIQRERARAYQARQELNARQQHRRTRDNVVGGIVGAVLLVGVIGVQVAYYTAGPGAPAPAPSPTTTAVSTPAPTATAPTPAPTAPAPSGSTTP